MARSGQTLRQRAMRSKRLFRRGRAAHGFEHGGRGVLEGDVEVGQDLALGHQRDDAIDVRIGIDVVQAHPGAELAKRCAQILEARRQRAALPLALRVLEVEAVGARVLADDQELLHAGFDETLGLGHHVRRRAARKIAAQGWDDAEGAAVVAALGNFQIRVVARREAQALRRHEVDVRIVQRRHGVVHGGDDLLVLMRAGDGEHAGVRGADARFLHAHAAGDDDAAVLRPWPRRSPPGSRPWR